MSKDDEFDRDDFIEKLKKFLDQNMDGYDMDFFVLSDDGKKGVNPRKLKNLDENLKKKLGLDPNNKFKGTKISYHYEPGMDKPEIKIEGEMDREKLNELFKRFFSGSPKMKKVRRVMSEARKEKKKIVDAGKFSLQPSQSEKKKLELEEKECKLMDPDVEMCRNGEKVEIIIQVPGIEEENIVLQFPTDRTLSFSAEGESRKYVKSIRLPFESSVEKASIEYNNGLAIIEVVRK
ncbi:MAG: Hsp20/alpha crystallin family protein [Promethearchaeia archaeon]